MNLKKIALCTIMTIGIGSITVMATADSKGDTFKLNKTTVKGYEQMDSSGKGYASTTIKKYSKGYEEGKPTVGANLYNISGNVLDFAYSQGVAGKGKTVYTRWLSDPSNATGISSNHSTHYKIDTTKSLPYLSRP
ncbi:hypothetical protein [Clostridium rectalis]|uniref:hypothetical protein n=1 Tax=Clostridium rectalis TaxID=2040295 RepID=UPI000F63D4E5|nr:hypothetical protein [Clostridium rectalis]